MGPNPIFGVSRKAMQQNEMWTSVLVNTPLFNRGELGPIPRSNCIILLAKGDQAGTVEIGFDSLKCDALKRLVCWSLVLFDGTRRRDCNHIFAGMAER